VRNLDQIRAKNALVAAAGIGKGKEGGDALTGFPGLIVNNGLLAALAFSLKQEGGYLDTCDALARHLSDPGIGRIKAKDARGMLRELYDGDSRLLRLCTAEALQYLNYLRRFAKAKEA
jgi:CRISPR/Cas system CMR-associated protein Cmr5 small subunit